MRRWPPRLAPPLWLRRSAAVCGVRNGYEQPERLGADRWAALIGARGLIRRRLPGRLRGNGDDRRLAATPTGRFAAA